jgi:outer membrane protein assembly factor BamB
VIGMDGRLYGLNLATGKDNFLPPIPFVAPFSKNMSLSVIDGVIYTALSQGCGDGPSGFYSVDTNSPHHSVVRRLVTSTDVITSGIWGRGGPVIGENHRIYGQTADGEVDAAAGDFGSSVVAALLPELDLADYFTPKNHDFLNKHDLDLGSASPVWFTHEGRQFLAGGGKEGVVYLMDADSLGGKDHQTPAYVSPRLGNDAQVYDQHGIWGAISYWHSNDGDTWIYVPVWGPLSKTVPPVPITNGPAPHGSILAFKVALGKDDHKPFLQLTWASGDFNLPDPPAIANGVVFALSTGENAQQNADRTKNTRPAVLYALDAKSGRQLWNCGNSINTWVHFSGLAIADGRVYAVDHDSWLYSFGLGQP